MSRELGGSRSPALPPSALVLVPVGSIEQHGPHLPLDTDTVIAGAVAHRVAGLLQRDDVVVAPAISYGASGEHQMFPGTSSIGTDVLRQTVVELTRSLRTWCARVVFVNAHGGNLAALTTAVEQLVAEGHDVAWVPCATEQVDAHAGLTETSLMLHLHPWAVRSDLAEAGNTRPIAELLPELVAGGVAAVSPNGVLGDPAGATAGEGQRVLHQMAADIAAAVSGGEADRHGRLRSVGAVR
ncbi:MULTISPECIES: mycofactocin biosynthesis peptidyl-dipeptidase MftE [unclassified Nocardioides]|uniref:mycofactocin biosynthesis peptidyl-dipeptidase MftE n=1 Tax=unclassified Nocardioides TaxID=2615069 RepID=UPI0009F06910|nr:MULTISPECIES: mycofactocin biosynthesis peptidyl-dipeptidase MftE [unclassified Nocardioides]GAW50984.1 Creatininase [Nocardioides sp. PD653-B2]GAW56289.1 Creatininase [Nocardioides sp. PD653]